MSLADFFASGQNVSGVGYGMQAGGLFAQGMGYLAHGLIQSRAAEFTAAQLRQNANAVTAASQRSAQDIARQAQYIAGTQLARAAASGGGAQDPTVLNLIARTHGEMAYRQSVALYGGEAQARQMQVAAAAAKYSGGQELRGGIGAGVTGSIASAATLLKGGVSLRDKYAPDLASPGEYAANDWLTS